MRTKVYLSYIFCMSIKHKMIFLTYHGRNYSMASSGFFLIFYFQQSLSPFPFVYVYVYSSFLNIICLERINEGWGPFSSNEFNHVLVIELVTSPFSKNVNHFHLCLEIIELLSIESQKL